MDTSKITLFRYDPTKDENPRYDQYEVPFDPAQTLLDSLKYIHEKHDRSLSFRGECGYQMCGTCAVSLNGKPALACNTNVEKALIVEPLPDIPIIKDLVIDRKWIYDRVNPAKSFFIRKTPLEHQPETISPDVYDLQTIAATCIECYVCTTSCPLYDQGTDPASNLKISRVAIDSRDGVNRIKALSDFISKCVVCGTCAGVCPLEVRVDRVVLSAREKFVEERGLSFVKRVAIQLTNLPTILWTMVRFGYPFRGLIFGRDKDSFPALAKETFQLRERGVKN